MTFSEENFYRTMTNLHIYTKIFTRPGYVPTKESQSELYNIVEETTQMSYMLHDNFHNQFNHNPKVRRVCPNENCHHIYAYFYEDFLYCPKCGTKLITTRDDRYAKEDKK